MAPARTVIPDERAPAREDPGSSAVPETSHGFRLAFACAHLAGMTIHFRDDTSDGYQ
jgi:hypothetical protein